MYIYIYIYTYKYMFMHIHIYTYWSVACGPPLTFPRHALKGTEKMCCVNPMNTYINTYRYIYIYIYIQESAYGIVYLCMY